MRKATKKISSMLKSFRYAVDNFGAAVSVHTAQRFEQLEKAGKTPSEASDEAYAELLDHFILAANEERAMEFINELPPSEREGVRARWFAILRNAGSNEEIRRE